MLGWLTATGGGGHTQYWVEVGLDSLGEALPSVMWARTWKQEEG